MSLPLSNFCFLFYLLFLLASSSKPEVACYAEQTNAKKSYCSCFGNALAAFSTVALTGFICSRVTRNPYSAVIFTVKLISSIYTQAGPSFRPRPAAISCRSDTTEQQRSNNARQQHYQQSLCSHLFSICGYPQIIYGVVLLKKFSVIEKLLKNLSVFSPTGKGISRRGGGRGKRGR